MRGPRGVPDRLGCVVPVVVGQVKLREVHERISAVQLELGVHHMFVILGGGQLSLVEGVGGPLAISARRRQPGEPGADAGW